LLRGSVRESSQSARRPSTASDCSTAQGPAWIGRAFWLLRDLAIEVVGPELTDVVVVFERGRDERAAANACGERRSSEATDREVEHHERLVELGVPAHIEAEID